MEVSFKKRFLKDLDKIPSSHVDGIKKVVFEDIPNATSLADIPNVVHISGTENFYRIRKGDYRIGFEVKESKILFYRVLHRREIYRKFP